MPPGTARKANRRYPQHRCQAAASAHDPMIPHTLVLKPGLVVHSIYNGYWYILIPAPPR